MILSDIINHTKSVLPLFTDLFTDNVSITSVSKSGDDVTVSAVAHGLSLAEDFVASGIRTVVVITAITSADGIATATCATNHDLTVGYTKNVDVTSAEAAFNGTFALLDAPSSKIFTYRITATPAGDSTGTLKTFHNLGFNGVRTVSEVIDADSFKYVFEDDNVVAGGGTAMLVMKDPRISGAAEFDRIVDGYTKQTTNGIWGLFVLDSSTTSSDRSIDNDSKNERQFGEDFKLRIIQDISFYVFIPTDAQISARQAIDRAQNLVKPIYKALAGYIPTTVFTTAQETIMMPSSHDLQLYNGAFVAYNYSFQSTEFMLYNGDSADPLEFMANTGDALPNMLTKGFTLFESKSINDKLEIVKDDTFEVQN